MATNRSTTPDVTATAEPPGGTTPSVETPPALTYLQLASQLITAMNQIEEIIPKLQVAAILTANQTRSRVAVPDAFIATVIAGVEQSPELQSVTRFDVSAARDALQFLNAFRPARDRSNAFEKSLKRSVDACKADVVTKALQVYAVAKSLARDPSKTAIASLADNMARDLGRRGSRTTTRRKAAAASTSVGAPTPQPLPSDNAEGAGS